MIVGVEASSPASICFIKTYWFLISNLYRIIFTFVYYVKHTEVQENDMIPLSSIVA